MTKGYFTFIRGTSASGTSTHYSLAGAISHLLLFVNPGDEWSLAYDHEEIASGKHQPPTTPEAGTPEADYWREMCDLYEGTSGICAAAAIRAVRARVNRRAALAGAAGEAKMSREQWLDQLAGLYPHQAAAIRAHEQAGADRAEREEKK